MEPRVADAIARRCVGAAVPGMARGQFAVAAAVLAGCPRRPMRPAVLMMALYRGLLDRLEAGEWRRFDQRARLPLAAKLWYALRHGVL